MNIFFLEDIRKTFYLVNLYYYINNEITKNDIFIYNDKIDDTIYYLNDFRLAFPGIPIISHDLYKKSLDINLDTIYLNHNLYSEKSINFITNLEPKNVVVLLNNNSGIKEFDLSIRKLKPNTFILWNHNFIFFLLQNRKSILLNEIDNFRELNYVLPNQLFFKHNEIDSLIFMPTKMAFEHEKDLNNFLFDLKNILDDYRHKNHKFYFKSHQGMKDNYLSTNIILINYLINLFSILSLKYLFKLSFFLKNNNYLLKIFNISIFNKLRNKYNFLNLEYPLLPIEFYINSVNDKLIGSFSNTLITSAFFDKKYVLIGDKKIKSNYIKRNIKVDSSLYLKLNMSFFLTEKNAYQFDSKPFFKKPIKSNNV